MVPADEEKSTKPASSTKSASSKTSLKEVGKTLSLINNAFKTMGKALIQVHEEIGTLADDESFEEQSRAQIGMVMCSKTSYSFATGKFSMRNHLLLDNQSLVHVFCNPQFVSNVRSAERQLKLTSNGGHLPISEVADFDGFNKEVWYSEDAITNILSLSLVKREYSISYMTGRILSSTKPSMVMQTWCSSHIQVGCMCMTQMTLGVMQAIPWSRQWKRTWLCSPSVRLLMPS
jgi:hypothetical protein